jgi:hypothetical protein
VRCFYVFGSPAQPYRTAPSERIFLGVSSMNSPSNLPARYCGSQNRVKGFSGPTLVRSRPLRCATPHCATTEVRSAPR